MLKNPEGNSKTAGELDWIYYLQSDIPIVYVPAAIPPS
jgi:hypothetical protein